MSEVLQRETNKRKCEKCSWHGVQGGVRTVLDPEDEHNSWQVCPSCGTADHIVSVCDEPGCRSIASVGKVHAHLPGRPYRWTCYTHSRED